MFFCKYIGKFSTDVHELFFPWKVITNLRPIRHASASEKYRLRYLRLLPVYAITQKVLDSFRWNFQGSFKGWNERRNFFRNRYDPPPGEQFCAEKVLPSLDDHIGKDQIKMLNMNLVARICNKLIMLYVSFFLWEVKKNLTYKMNF